MSLQHLCIQGLLIVLVAIGACTDVRSRRIPNWLNLTLLASGLILSATMLRLVTPSQAFAGAGVGLAIPLVLHILGGLGAGDVKLLCGIGAWVGPKMVIYIIAGAAIAGLVLVIAQCLVERRVGVLLRNTGVLALSLVNLPRLGLGQVIETGQRCQSARRPMPYAVPVLAGTIAAMLMLNLGSGGGML
ncbi:MAG TPA: A24 family peptidase [Tepidisphaeraceae bacterium]|jgi:prepilin peptidase CpaA